MGVRTVDAPGVDCGQDHTPGGVACPGHEVMVRVHRSSDTWTLIVDGEQLVLTDKLFDALRTMMNAAVSPDG